MWHSKPHLCTLRLVSLGLRTYKKIDDAHQIRCKSGTLGVLREEVWVDHKNSIVRYNLAFVNRSVFPKDNGRVLGYDNAHGVHERHYMGIVQQVAFTSYEQTLQRFLDEVKVLKETV